MSALLDSRLGMSPYLGDDEPPQQVPPDLRPFMPATFDHQAFERFDVPVAESGQFWSDMIIPALDVLASLPAGRVLQVSYEDLVAEPRQVLLRLARFAGLPEAHPGWLDRAAQLAQPRSPRWPGLPHDQIRELTRVCEPAMRRLYGGDRALSRTWRPDEDRQRGQRRDRQHGGTLSAHDASPHATRTWTPPPRRGNSQGLAAARMAQVSGTSELMTQIHDA